MKNIIMAKREGQFYFTGNKAQRKKKFLISSK